MYHGDITLTDFYRDIDKGISFFFQSYYAYPHYTFDENHVFVLHLSPRCYYTFPIVEIVNYYLAKHCKKYLSPMALTAFHEALSNSLLWGLLKVKRPEDILDFHKYIEKKLIETQSQRKTLCVAVQIEPCFSIKIINPYDENFNFESFQSTPSLHIRGSDILRLFSQMDYDKSTYTLTLNFGEADNVYQAVAQS